MCGIYFSLSRNGYIAPNAGIELLLKNRGPDSIGEHHALTPAESSSDQASSVQLHATFLSTVLALRGTAIVEQPLKDDETGSALCWNGEAWSIHGHLDSIPGNDSQAVFALLLQATHVPSPDVKSSSVERVLRTLSAIRGPYAFVFYDAENNILFFGRDCLGRRSLLRQSTSDDRLVLSSVRDSASGDKWAEVEPDGIYMVDLQSSHSNDAVLNVTHVPHRREGEPKTNQLSFVAMNKTMQNDGLHPKVEHVQEIDAALRKSLEVRVQHVRESISSNSDEASVAVLFSGGLDCTILARMCHDLLPLTETIDLHNVAFQNPRIHGKLDDTESPYELCPDRITGRSSYMELRRVCPNRQWRLVEINVPYSETVAHRSKVMELMYPHNTEMDLSISYALYFASRGAGVWTPPEGGSPQPHSNQAHVLISGLGADELFGGYQRHSTAFTRHGYSGLIEELELDFNRLGKRNLGRDDRVISDSGKEVRFPFLDEDFISLTLNLPVWAKCDFANAQQKNSDDPRLFLEPGKRILRLLAYDLDMKGVAAEPKRAIQFGARTAKMEVGKTKGTAVLT